MKAHTLVYHGKNYASKCGRPTLIYELNAFPRAPRIDIRNPMIYPALWDHSQRSAANTALYNCQTMA